MKSQLSSKQVGKRIKKARISRGFTQQEVSEKMALVCDKKTVARTAISQWECGKIKEISAVNLLKLAAVLNANPYWLIFGDAV